MSAELEQLFDQKRKHRGDLISIVLPVYNEIGSLPVVVRELYDYLHSELSSYRFEISFVDDCSTDGSFESLRLLSADSPPNVRLSVLRLRKNSGSHVAITAGLNISRGDFTVIMASDGQDPASVVGDLIREWEAGFDVVLAARSANFDHGFVGQLFSRLAWKVMIWSTGIPTMPESGCDLLGLDREAVQAFKRLDERNTTFVFRILSLGFPQREIEYVKRARLAGRSKWTFLKKLSIMLDAITGYSNRPLRLVTKIGVFVFALLIFRWSVVVVNVYLLHARATDLTIILNAIFTSLAVVVLLLGVIGDYIWRILDETRKRPLYEISAVDGKIFEKAGLEQ
jgi:glycosyltransferase involved in cell wall biosynthesis